jgi:subtilase family serine protease
MAPPGGFGAAERIRVIIRNQGEAPAAASQTSVVFGIDGAAPPPGSAVRIAQTPALDAGESASHEFRIPTACYGPPETQCRFIIMADAGPEAVIESNEANNTAASLCINFHIEP